MSRLSEIPSARYAAPPIPVAVGPLTEYLVEVMSGERLPSEVVVDQLAIGCPLTDDDMHRALYMLYELHYRGFDDVSPDLEWNLDLLAVRLELEDLFLHALFSDVGPPEDCVAADMEVELRRLLEGFELPPMPRYLETQANLDQFVEYAIHRSAFQLKEADPYTWAIPRLDGPPKAALLEIQIDEYGGGSLSHMHSELFAQTLKELGLKQGYGSYIHMLPGVTLATVNVMSMFGLHYRWRGASIGNLAAFEMGSSAPNRQYSNGLKRLGQSKVARTFYDVHVLADAAHEQVAASDLAQGLAVQQPHLAGDILFGAHVSAACEARFFSYLLTAWKGGRSSLMQC